MGKLYRELWKYQSLTYPMCQMGGITKHVYIGVWNQSVSDQLGVLGGGYFFKTIFNDTTSHCDLCL